MDMLFFIGGIALTLATAVVALMLRARRRRAEDEARAGAKQEAKRQAEAARQPAEEVARLAAEQEAQRQAEDARQRAEEEDRAQAEREAQRQAEELARIAAEQEAQRQVEDARRRAEEEDRAEAEREAQRQAGEARRQAEELDRVAAEQEAQRQVEDARRRAEEEDRAEAEREAQRQAEEARRQAEELDRVAAEQEAQRQVEDARRRAEEEDRAEAEREAQRQAEEARQQAEELARVAAELGDTPAGWEQREAGARQATQVAETGSTETGEASGVLLGLDSSDVAATSAQGALVSGPLGAPALSSRTPRQFRPAARAPTPHRAAPVSPTTEREARDRAMPIEVRLVFEKAGFCRVSLVPRRAAGMPVEFAVTGSGSPPDLLALQDEWYQDVVLPDIGRLLVEGIEWAGPLADGGAGRFSLSGRGLYVLAPGELNGFVSTPRLVLGEEHVVLCVAERLPEVRAAIALTDSPEPHLLNSESGIPAGWVGLRGVLPRRPVAPSPDGDILDALRPLPDVEISLKGGIRIDRQTWLSGFPPTIHLLGDTSTIDVITIDGREATRSPDGGYVVPGCDSSGEHTVWCMATSRTYAIRGGAEDWEPWDAYAWSLGELSAAGTQSRPGICGVLVRAPRAARPNSRPTVVAASNPILIGARPGEIEVCTRRRDVRAGFCVGFPWFEPVWAIPADALHCNKHTARVLLIGQPRAVVEGDQPSKRSAGRVSRRRAPAWRYHTWCDAILAAGRKGLRPEPSRTEIADLWNTYKRYAKGLRRGWR